MTFFDIFAESELFGNLGGEKQPKFAIRPIIFQHFLNCFAHNPCDNGTTAPLP